jgi:hypothetical protein
LFFYAATTAAPRRDHDSLDAGTWRGGGAWKY